MTERKVFMQKVEQTIKENKKAADADVEKFKQSKESAQTNILNLLVCYRFYANVLDR